ncbi:MAG: hypothetical protein Q8O22_03970 [Candidatus Omnitrophota bacterium]|nr:hypothetical protein [Candidatus Omnitrophota bacterium]
MIKNKRTGVVLLGLAMLTFVASGCVNQTKVKDLEKEVGRLNQVIQQKDAKIKALTDQTQAGQKSLDTVQNELNSIKNELDNTKKELENVNNKLKAVVVPPLAKAVK